MIETVIINMHQCIPKVQRLEGLATKKSNRTRELACCCRFFSGRAKADQWIGEHDPPTPLRPWNQMDLRFRHRLGRYPHNPSQQMHSRGVFPETYFRPFGNEIHYLPSPPRFLHQRPVSQYIHTRSRWHTQTGIHRHLAQRFRGNGNGTCRLWPLLHTIRLP